MRNIIDKNPAISGSYAKTVFCRSDRVKSEVGLLDWCVLTIVELIVGEELLEQLVTTSAYNETEKTKVGHFLHLSDMVPSGRITNALRRKIYQVLYYKYYKQYLFLTPEAAIDNFETTARLDLRRARFGMRHDLLYQVIAFRRVYILAWLFSNVTINVALYLTADLQSALLGALSVEGIRRLFRL